MYDSGRFFVMTGNAISDREDVPDRTEEIKPLHQKYLGGSEKSDSGQMTLSETSLSVHEIIEKARNSRGGAKFESLYQGDFSEYPSQSEADIAFVICWLSGAQVMPEKWTKSIAVLDSCAKNGTENSPARLTAH